VLSADDEQALLYFRIVIHLGDPTLEPSVNGIDAVPSILRRVGIDPLHRIRRAGAHCRLDLLDLTSEFCDEPTGLPLRLSSHVSIHPEAAPAPGCDAQRRVVLTVFDPASRVSQERALLEAERVDLS